MTFSVDTNADVYAVTCADRARRTPQAQKRANAKIRSVLMERAQWWSSGPFSLTELARMGHPYARRNRIVTRHGGKKMISFAKRVGEQFPHRINRQSGDYIAGWRTSDAVHEDTATVTLKNVSRHARFLTPRGTPNMIGRNPLGGIMRDSRKRIQAVERQVVPDAVRGTTSRTGIRPGQLRQAFMTGFRFGMAMGG